MAEDATIFDSLETSEQQTEQQTAETQTAETQDTEQQQTVNNEWLPEEYRSDKSFEKFKDISGLAKSYKEMQSMLGKKGSAIPTAESSPEEWQNFYKSLGVPEEATGYTLDVDAELKLPETLYDDNMKKIYQDVFKEANLTPAQAKVIWDARNKYLVDEIANQQTEYNKMVENVTNQLKKDWGDKFNSELNKSLQSFRYLFPDTDPKDHPLVNNIDFLRTLNKIHSLIGDDKIIETKQTPNSAQAIDSEINEILNNPDYSNAMAVNHNNLVDRMVELQQKKLALKG
jgi:hypothetical protein